MNKAAFHENELKEGGPEMDRCDICKQHNRNGRTLIQGNFRVVICGTCEKALRSRETARVSRKETGRSGSDSIGEGPSGIQSEPPQ